MKAIIVEAHDRPPLLREIVEPRPGPGEISISVEACGLNFADLLLAKGEYQEHPSLPCALGLEVAGTVVGLGPGISRVRIGDRVASHLGHGGLAEIAIASEDRCVAIPKGVSAVDAAATLIAHGTSHLALTRRANLQPGETLLVSGAAGGVGLSAVELGAAMGANVIAVARGADKLEAARQAGAHHMIDGEDPDLVDRIRDLGGADVIYDPVGGPLFKAAIRCCRPEARYLTIGFAGGLPEVQANHLLVKNISLIGFYWGSYWTFAPDALRQSLSNVFALLEQGQIKPHVSHVLPLERATEGLEMIRSRNSTGKVVITPAIGMTTA